VVADKAADRVAAVKVADNDRVAAKVADSAKVDREAVSGRAAKAPVSQVVGKSSMLKPAVILLSIALCAVPVAAQTTQPAPEQPAAEPALTPADDDDYDWGWLGLLGLLGLAGLIRRNEPAVVVRNRTEPETTRVRTGRDR
jgi:MYXO-CTERM domain-containing protein